MIIPETVLIFVGAPAGIIAVITLAVLGPSELRAPARYRPGRPWPHQPAWYIPHPVSAGPPPSHGVGHAELTAHEFPALTSGATAERRRERAVGGASGEW